MKSALAKVSLIFLGIASGLLLMEGATRLLFLGVVSYDHPDIFWDHWSRPSEEKTKQLALAFNEMGIYDEKLGYISGEVDAAESKFESRSGFRIMLLGDSIMYSSEFSEPIQAALRNRYPKVRLDFFNASAPGWDSLQEVTYLKTRGMKYRPKMVILQFCINDFSATPVFWKTESGQFVALNFGKWGKYLNSSFLLKSRLFQRVLIAYLRFFPFDYVMDAEKVRESMKTLASISSSHGIEPHVILVPYFRVPVKNDIRRTELVRKIANEFFRPEQISDFLSLQHDPRVTQWRREENDYTHPNTEFSELVAAKIVKKLKIISETK